MVVMEGAEEEDMLIWRDDAKGVFTVSKAYKCLTPSGAQPSWPGWRRTWKLRVEQRIRTFLWLLSHDSLLCNFNRWRKGIADTAECQLCLAQTETSLHVVRDCQSAR